MTARAPLGSLPPRLDPRGVYRTPLGRFCMVRDVEYREPLLRNGAAVAHLEYLRPDRRVANTNIPDGFSLSRDNWPMLTQVGQLPEGR